MRRSLSTTASLVVAVPPLPPGGPRSAGRARCGNASRSSTRIGRGSCAEALPTSSGEIMLRCMTSCIRWVSFVGRSRRRWTASSSRSVTRPARSGPASRLPGGHRVLDGGEPTGQQVGERQPVQRSGQLADRADPPDHLDGTGLQDTGGGVVAPFGLRGTAQQQVVGRFGEPAAALHQPSQVQQHGTSPAAGNQRLGPCRTARRSRRSPAPPSAVSNGTLPPLPTPIRGRLPRVAGEGRDSLRICLAERCANAAH